MAKKPNIKDYDRWNATGIKVIKKPNTNNGKKVKRGK